MRRLALAFGAAAFLAVVPAQAKQPSHPTHPVHPSHPAHPSHPSSGNGNNGGSHSCTARQEGYNARGTLVSSALAATGSKDRYDGTLTVDVTRANHKAPTGSQTYTLTNARVRFGKGVDATSPAAGSRVRIHGRITVLPHGCSSSGFTPTITVRNVRISAAH